MFLAAAGIIPPAQWHHNPRLINMKGESVADLLRKNNVEVPEEWLD